MQPLGGLAQQKVDAMAINSFRLAVAIIEIEKQTSDYEKRWLILKQWLSKEEAAQQSVQLTGGTLPDFQADSTPEDLSGLEADTTPPTSN